MKIFKIIILLALSVSSAAAAEVEIQPLDKDLNPVKEEISFDKYNFKLEDAVKIALRQNRSVIDSDISYDKASSSVGEARTAMSTKVSANFKQTRLGYRTVMAATGAPLNKKDTQSYYAELSQPLFLGKKDRAALESARIGRDIAGFSKTLTKQQIIMIVSMRYYSWLFARAVESVGKEDLDLAQAHFELVSKRYAAQQTSKYEVLRAEVRLTQSKSAYLKSQNDAKLAELDLLNVLSLPIDGGIDTKAKLVAIDYEAELDKDLETAKKVREDIKIKTKMQDIAQQTMVAAKGENQPVVSLWAQYGVEDPSSRYSGAFKRDDYWMAGLVMNVPIVDAGLTKSKVAKAHTEIRKAKNDLEDTLEQAELEIRQAALTLHSSAEIVAAQKENMKQAEETVRLAKVRYENGIFTQVDLFDAENAWSNTKLLYNQAVLGHHNARLAYQLAVGNLGRELLK